MLPGLMKVSVRVNVFNSLAGSTPLAVGSLASALHWLPELGTQPVSLARGNLNECFEVSRSVPPATF